jgi:hypothetical protein
MPDELETILRLVAEGHLSADEAAPIIAALTRPAAAASERSRRHERVGRVEAARERAEEARLRADALRAERRGGRGGRQVRIRVTERGRQVVNLRIPLTFADLALRAVPGLGEEQAGRIRAAIDSGTLGPIVDVEDEDGDGVLISVE